MFDEILQNIRIPEKEAQRIANFLDQLIAKCKEWTEDENIEIMLCGSMAKGTALYDSSDIDVFLLFDKDTRMEYLKSWGLYFGHEITEDLGGKSIEKYASHPYVTAKIQGFDIDFVPCYKIDNAKELKSAVDRTPLHTRYVLQNLTPNKRDDVLLLKQFMKTTNVYGANTQVNGFSGYLCEILIMYYGGFIQTLEACQHWTPRTIIDLEKNGFLFSPAETSPTLIVPDPIDNTRNVAAALSLQKMRDFQLAAYWFLHSTNKDKKEFFAYRRNFCSFDTHKEYELVKDYTINIKFPAPKIPEDALHSQLQSTLVALTDFYTQYGYNVVTSDYLIENHTCSIAFIFDCIEQNPLKEHIGPHFDSPGREGFMMKHGFENIQIKKTGHLYTFIENPAPTVYALTDQILNGEHNIGGGKQVKQSLIDYGYTESIKEVSEHIPRMLKTNYHLYRKHLNITMDK